MSLLENLLKKAGSYKENHPTSQLLKQVNLSAEIAGMEAPYEFMLKLAEQEQVDITEEIVIKLHQLFYQTTNPTLAGQYRTDQENMEGEYIPPTSENIPHLMGHLANQIESSGSTLHPIELAAMTYKRIVDIAPFVDGNEAVAWLVMNLILVHAGYPMTSIPSRRQDEYLSALSASRAEYDMVPFSTLIAECVIEAQLSL